MTTNEIYQKEAECEILLQSASPDIYQKNAFRISGLNVIASTREISNQIQKSQLNEKYGNKTEVNDSPFSISPPPDNDQMRQALHRLKDPETRIVDEFFWFWPQSLETHQKDNALVALSRNDIKTAESLWINYESTLTESNVSRHNLAVLSHLMVMDIELNRKSLTQDEIIKRDKYWEDTFKRWKLLLDHEGFWSRLMSRVRQMDDPRLTTGFVRRLRASLPSAILQINAMLALTAAESGNGKEAARQLNLMNNSGLGDDYVLPALKQVVNPLRNRIKVICKSFSDSTGNTSENDLSACNTLISQTKEILKTIDTLLPDNNVIKEGAHDEVALAALSLVISYANETSDWETALLVFEELKMIVIGESARIRVENNFDIFKSNLEYDRLYNTCFFCKKNKSDTSSSCKIAMHGNIQLVVKIGEIEIPYTDAYAGSGLPVYRTWSYNTIEVPRCKECEKQHSQEDKFTWIGGGLGLLIGLGVIGLLEYHWAVVIIFIVLGFIIGSLYDSSRIKIKNYSHYKEFPRIKEHLEQGWTWGEKPQPTN